MGSFKNSCEEDPFRRKEIKTATYSLQSQRSGKVVESTRETGGQSSDSMEELAKAMTTFTERMGDVMEQQTEGQQKLVKSLVKRKENSEPRIKLAEYKEGEDIEDFLEMFEGKMQLHEIEKRKWIVYLTELHQGKAREACQGVNYSITDYDNLKDTLLR